MHLFLIRFKLSISEKTISTTMKTITGFFTLLFTCSVLSSFSQEQVIRLKMKEGYEYTFERIDRSYSIKEDGSKVIVQDETKKFKIEIEKNVPDSILTCCAV